MSGKTITDYRAKMHLSCEMLADELAVKTSLVVEWEKGESIPSKDQIAKLADIFHVSKESLAKEMGQTQSNGFVFYPNHANAKKRLTQTDMVAIAVFFIGLVTLAILIAIAFLEPIHHTLPNLQEVTGLMAYLYRYPLFLVLMGMAILFVILGGLLLIPLKQILKREHHSEPSGNSIERRKD
jgi:transcriptional regulator with XRE-family HTH domain